MLNRWSVQFAILTVFLVAPAAAATPPVHVLLKSGQELTGELIKAGNASNGKELVLRVDGRDHQLDINEVALVDFGPGIERVPGDIPEWSAGKELVVLKSGVRFPARLVGAACAGPIQLTFETPSGPRIVSSSELNRLVFDSETIERLTRADGPSDGADRTAAVADQTPLVVRATETWTHTGLIVHAGQRLHFNVAGEVLLSTNSVDRALADGSALRRKAPRSPLPRVLAGTLVGRVGDSDPFVVGRKDVVTMPAGGELMLRVNDDYLGDNSGEFRVIIRSLVEATR